MFAYATGFLLPMLVIVGAVLYFGPWVLMVPVAIAVAIIVFVVQINRHRHLS